MSNSFLPLVLYVMLYVQHAGVSLMCSYSARCFETRNPFKDLLSVVSSSCCTVQSESHSMDFKSCSTGMSTFLSSAAMFYFICASVPIVDPYVECRDRCFREQFAASNHCSCELAMSGTPHFLLPAVYTL